MKNWIFAAMVFRFAPETLLSSLGIMCKGMLGIFAVIIVIWLFVTLLGKWTAGNGGAKQ